MFNPLEPLETRELFSAVPGIYSNGELLVGERYAIRADANLLPSVRNALDEGRVDIEVVLDPGETYRLQPIDGGPSTVINDLYLRDDKLTFTADPAADADGSGGRASLEVERSESGRRTFPIIIDSKRGGELTLDGVDLSASDHQPGEYIRFVANHGPGSVTLNDASIASARISTAVASPAKPLEPIRTPIDLKPGAPAGIYENGALLSGERFELKSGENILPSVRHALDGGHRNILVALDPGETYYLNPQEQAGLPFINDLFLDGADLTVAAIEEIDADGSGGRADLVVQRNARGGFSNPFYLHASGSGNLQLESVDLSAEGRRSGEFVGFISHYGDGDVRLVDASLEGPTRRFPVSGTAAPAPAPGLPRPVLPTQPARPVAPARPAPPAGEVTAGTGIYLLDGTKLDGYDLRSNTNIIPVIRLAMDRGYTSIEVRLDPGETYDFSPQRGPGLKTVGNLSMSGADLRLVSAASADNDGSGGFATLEVGPDAYGKWSNIIFMPSTSEGKLTLDGISMTMPERQPDDFVDFIVWRGGGELTLFDSKLSGARNNIDVSGFGGPQSQGADIVIDRSIIEHSNAPDRDLYFEPGRTGGPANGIYARNYNSIKVQDSVFYHNGWRDDAFLNTHASAYSHGLYLNTGDAKSFDPRDTQIINTIFSDNGANAAQLRQGGIVRDSFFYNSPFGISLPAGEVSSSAFASGDTIWPRDGETKTGYQRWKDRGGYQIQIDHDARIDSRRLGPVAVRNNVFADAQANHEQRGPIHHNPDPARPQPVRASGNYELNWVDYQPFTPGNNYSGVGIDRFNTGSTALDGEFGSRYQTVDEIVDAAVNRDRGGYGLDGLPEARDLVSFYRNRALAAAG
ncbi:right-handed parallel beta-helix repeat-containing protein [Phycisphaera mikurensis]|uniref:Right handed beta helix domain-containing protein n=1 Tax=Phycisphaera mikurensis (strain NBRC 102666 / KCTC 22515 / FYK2301M01) TaxID=1142394 RepID=I0IHX9_PHYMF|nr:right-handed parallel beta-helix repeat-containing protein [Phycisphaera mikurensis]MBB6441107.1 hypothetical protein [Phycisphaera mikurensis]BAM04867.1 hypothetical protein PSMK_27080 [Phycisphaera mikurensis NBRC 102666]